jgi:serine/threonine protein kinase
MLRGMTCPSFARWVTRSCAARRRASPPTPAPSQGTTYRAHEGMQYIEGETLDDYLKRAKGGRLPLKQVRAIGVQLSNVLSYLHAQTPPIIFRDVKPANIMRTRWGRLYLIDFGTARRFNLDKKRDTSPLGSPGYAAPEQYGRAQSTAKTDIYGLGVTLQSLLTGKEPLDDAPVTPPTGKPHPACQQLQQVLDEMQTTDAFWRPHTTWDVKKRLLFIPPGNPRLMAMRQKAVPLLIGLFLGSLPYSFLPLVWLFSSRAPNADTMVPCTCPAPFLPLAVRLHVPRRDGVFPPLRCPPSPALDSLWYPDHAHAHAPGAFLGLAPVAEQPHPLGQAGDVVLRAGACV